jgi:hypothetical protein
MDTLIKQFQELLGDNGVLTGADVSSREAAGRVPAPVKPPPCCDLKTLPRYQRS